MNKIINETMNKIDEKDTLEATVPKLYKDLNPTVKEKLTNALYGSMNTPQYIEKFSERHPELKITDVIDCVNMSKDLETKLQFIEKFIDRGYTLGGAKTLIDLALDYSLDTDNGVTDQTKNDNNMSDDVGMPQILREMENIYLTDKSNFVFSRALQLATNTINKEYFNVDTPD